MMTSPHETIRALENMTDFAGFERLCCDLLSCYGQYAGIIPQGVGRIDGGKDAILIKRTDDSVIGCRQKIIFHFSLRKDYYKKIFEDLECVKKNNLNPTQVVFVTSRLCVPGKKTKLEKEAKDRYGWDLIIYDQEWLRIPLGANFQNLRRIYLGLDFDLTTFAKLDDLLEHPYRHPNRLDFEQGLYYRNDILHSAVHDKLKKKSRCLIIGKPGSGKTSLARGIGYDFIKKNHQNTIFYLSASTDQETLSSEWLKQIKQSDHSYVLFIIDNCHKAVSAVNAFVEKWHAVKQAKVLFISRSIHTDFTGTVEESYLEILEPVTIPIVCDKESEKKTLLEIVKRLEKRKDKKGKEIGDIDIILDKCRGDLHLLNYFVYEWLNEKSSFKRLSDVDEMAVLKNVYNLYLKDKHYSEQLLSIAALSQFEIQVEGKWLGDHEAINSILKDALIEKTIENISGVPTIYLQYFHSTPAAYLVRACFKNGILGKPLDSYLIEKLEQYLSCKPYNFFELFFQLFINDRKDLQEALFQKETTFRLYKELISSEQLPNISRFLLSVWNWEERKENGKALQLLQELIKELGEKGWKEFYQTANWGAVIFTIINLGRIDMGCVGNILPLLDFKTLGARAQDVGLGAVVNFLQKTTQAGIDKDKINKFCNGLDFQALGERSQDVGLATVRNFIQLYTQVGIDKAQINEFYNSLDFKALGERSQDVGLATVKTFLQLSTLVGVDKAQINEFCNGLDFKALGVRSQDVGLATVRSFLELTTQARLDKAKINAFCHRLDFKALGERSQDVGLATVMTFLKLTTQAGVDKAQINAFCHALDWKKSGQAYKDKERSVNTLLFLFHLFLKMPISKNIILQFIEGIEW